MNCCRKNREPLLPPAAASMFLNIVCMISCCCRCQSKWKRGVGQQQHRGACGARERAKNTCPICLGREDKHNEMHLCNRSCMMAIQHLRPSGQDANTTLLQTVSSSFTSPSFSPSARLTAPTAPNVQLVWRATRDAAATFDYCTTHTSFLTAWSNCCTPTEGFGWATPPLLSPPFRVLPPAAWVSADSTAGRGNRELTKRRSRASAVCSIFFVSDSAVYVADT